MGATARTMPKSVRPRDTIRLASSLCASGVSASDPGPAVMTEEANTADATGISADATGISVDATGIGADATGISTDATGISADATGISADAKGSDDRGG
eukprot:2317243-Pyramimonas_sp.AAC.1